MSHKDTQPLILDHVTLIEKDSATVLTDIQNKTGNVCVTQHCGTFLYPLLQLENNNGFCVCC